jgi:hypothetical protein
MSERAITIYALIDPRTDGVRYVGKSVNVVQRYRIHCVARGNRHSAVWIRSLRNVGLRPVLTILEVATEEMWEERERYWIAFYREQGCDLTNLTDGGEGMHGISPSAETRRKLSMAGLIAQNRPEAKAAARERMVARYADLTERERQSQRSHEVGVRPEVIVSRRASMQLMLKDPAQLERFSANLKTARANPDLEAKRLANMRAAATPEVEVRRIAASKAVRSTDMSRAKSSISTAALWADPVWKANMLAVRARKKAARLAAIDHLGSDQQDQHSGNANDGILNNE